MGGGMDIKNLGAIAGMNSADTLAQAQAGRNSSQIKKLEGSKDVKQAATQFEAMLVQQMMNSMWETVPDGGMFGGSQEAGIYRDMLTQAFAEQIANGQGIGIKQVIEGDINRLDKVKK